LPRGSIRGSSKLSAESHFDSDADLQRYEVLLEMADLVVHHHTLPGLFVALAERMNHVAAADAGHFALYDPDKNVMRGHFWEKNTLSTVEQTRVVNESPSGWAWQNQQSLVVPDLAADPRFTPVLSMLREKGLRSYCWLPLTTAEKRLGALGLGSSQTNAYGEKVIRLLRRLAKLVAVAVENAITREALVREKERLHLLLEVNNTLVTNRDLQKLFPAISEFIRRMIHYDYASVAVYDEAPTLCLSTRWTRL
jgi:formate hydrogenlyase transcriptional activator